MLLIGKTCGWNNSKPYLEILIYFCWVQNLTKQNWLRPVSGNVPGSFWWFVLWICIKKHCKKVAASVVVVK